ncbi:hypothetical protein [Kiloniella laminariae]|uniref:hypothetical protein n=1 Tax=Kiloniella laminariae TaxID=454162 RepID=UPI0003764520|nr:hypothetical protein [Kiloniella laminariae]
MTSQPHPPSTVFKKPAPLPPIGNWGAAPSRLSGGEKLICALFSGLIAGACGLPFAFFLEPLPMFCSALLVGGLVLPPCFSLQVWRPGRAFCGGILTTLLSAGVFILLLSITVIHSSRDFTDAHTTVFGIIMIFAAGLSLPFGLAAILLDWLLLRRRQGE